MKVEWTDGGYDMWMQEDFLQGVSTTGDYRFTIRKEQRNGYAIARIDMSFVDDHFLPFSVKVSEFAAGEFEDAKAWCEMMCEWLSERKAHE